SYDLELVDGVALHLDSAAWGCRGPLVSQSLRAAGHAAHERLRSAAAADRFPLRPLRVGGAGLSRRATGPTQAWRLSQLAQAAPRAGDGVQGRLPGQPLDGQPGKRGPAPR